MRYNCVRGFQRTGSSSARQSHYLVERAIYVRSRMRCFCSSATRPEEIQSSPDDLFRYTSGRWLWNENEQSHLRYKEFDVSALMHVAAASSGREHCVSITKIAEGGFNRVFRLAMDDGYTVIARILYPNVVEPSKTIRSEMATMDFASSILGIPVPKVITWSADAGNDVGTEYILMEEALGSQLGQIWSDLDLTCKLKIIDEIVDIQKKLLSISFKWHGNLYFREDAFPGCVKAEVMSAAPQREEIERRFVIGPIIDRDLPYQNGSNFTATHGPWRSPTEYLVSVATRQTEWLNRFAMVRKPRAQSLLTTARSPTAVTKELLEKFITIAPFLVPGFPLESAKLWHWDIHASNLFVKDNRIYSVIDWQDVWTGPLFLQAQQPPLVQYDGPLMLNFPTEYKALSNMEEKAKIFKQVESSLALWTYETETKTRNPDLHQAFQLPRGLTRKQVVDQVKEAWNGDSLALRQSLMHVTQSWNEIHSEIPCPIAFTAEELKQHYQEADAWNDRAEFWQSINEFVQRDGWTFNDTYVQAREMFAQLREEALQNLTGLEREEFEKETRWAQRV